MSEPEARFQTTSQVQGFPSSARTMIDRGQDPKEFLIEVCKPQCVYWHDKLKRCEAALKSMSGVDPEKSCMYPMRDWVTCIESCVQPKIFNLLKGTEKGIIS